MEVTLNLEDIRIIELWANKTIQGGHWGDASTMLGEEISLKEKLSKLKPGVCEISNLELRTLHYWLENVHPDIRSINAGFSEIELVKKIDSLYQQSLSLH